MKKLIAMALLACIATGMNAQDKKGTAEKNKPVFTTIKENKITSIKDQNRSGTCWAYSTLSFFENEILKKTGKTYVTTIAATAATSSEANSLVLIGIISGNFS